MEIREPMTMATDYLLGLVTLVLAPRLWRAGTAPARYLAIMFWALTVAAFAGGTYHGFIVYLTPPWDTLVWKLTLYSIGVADAALVLALIRSTVTTHRRWLEAVVAIKLAVYVAWMTVHDEFHYVVFDYVPSLVLALITGLWLMSRREAAGRTLVAAVGVSFVAAGIQLSGRGFHEHFNHNDLYHVVQIAGMVLFFQAGIRLRDRGTPA